MTPFKSQTDPLVPPATADMHLRLYQVLHPRLAKERMTPLYENMERPLIHVLARKPQPEAQNPTP